MKKEITLDGKSILSIEDFHREILKKMEFPSYYGNNLDALWDCLTGHADLNVILIWNAHQISRNAMGKDFEKLVTLFIELKEEYPEFDLVLD